MTLLDNNFYKIVDYLAELFQAAFNTQIHLDSFARNLSHSDVIENIENNDESFLDRNIDFEKEKILGTKCLEYDWRISDLAYWIAEAYLRIFYRHRRSFEYIFLVLPIKEMILKFDLYHLEDFDSIVNLFSLIEGKSTLLNRLLKQEDLTIHELSELSGISKNTLMKYAKSDSYLYEGSFDKVMNIAKVFDVKPNIFLKDIRVHMSRIINIEENYNAEYRLYYYFTILCYFVSDLIYDDFVYNSKDNCFENIKKDQIAFVIENKSTYENALSVLNNKNFKEENAYILLINKSDEMNEIIKNCRLFKSKINLFSIENCNLINLRSLKEYFIKYRVKLHADEIGIRNA